MDEFKFPDEQDPKKTAAEADGGSDSKDDIDVEVIDDTPAPDRGRKPMAKPAEDPTDEEMEQYSTAVQSRFKELTRARHDERRARESAQRERDEAVRVAQHLTADAKRMREYVHTGEQAFATTAVAGAEAEMAMAKAKLKKAHEDFDTDAIVAAQQELNEVSFKLHEAKRFKPTPLQTEEEGVYSGPQHAQQPTGPDAKTLRWQGRNTWFGENEEMTSLALGVHKSLVSSGVDPRSDEYFAQLDARMRKRFPEEFESKDESPGEERTPAPRAKPSSPVAPVTRSQAPRKIQLTSTQVALASKLGLTPQQYAAEIVKLERTNG